jgi:hypothetical protein
MHQDRTTLSVLVQLLCYKAGTELQFASRASVTTTAAAAVAAAVAADVRGLETHLEIVPAEPVGPLPRKGPPRQLNAGSIVASLAPAAAGAFGQQRESRHDS